MRTIRLDHIVVSSSRAAVPTTSILQRRGASVKGLSLFLSLGLLLVGQCFASGPFGFDKGMTRSQVIQLVGNDAVDAKNSDADTLVIKTAPKPHPAFENYMLVFSPKDGLVKLIAIGNTIESDSYGTQVKNEASTMFSKGYVYSVYKGELP
jgi:hypothetical protein